MGSVLVGIRLVIWRNRSICFIALDDIAIFDKNLFAFGNDRVKWLIEIVLG